MKALAKWERFIERTESCWIWKGATKGGYGIVGVGGRSNPKHLKVHRLVILGFENYSNPGLVCHKCNNPLCVNPSHLYLGDYKSNYDDMVAAGRTGPEFLNAQGLKGNLHAMRGEKHPQSKMRDQDAREIRRRHRMGESLRVISAEMGISFYVCNDVAYGRSWKHVQ